MNSDDDIDRTYLLEAIVADLRILAAGGEVTAVAHLFLNPVS